MRPIVSNERDGSKDERWKILQHTWKTTNVWELKLLMLGEKRHDNKKEGLIKKVANIQRRQWKQRWRNWRTREEKLRVAWLMCGQHLILCFFLIFHHVVSSTWVSGSWFNNCRPTLFMLFFIFLLITEHIKSANQTAFCNSTHFLNKGINILRSVVNAFWHLGLLRSVFVLLGHYYKKKVSISLYRTDTMREGKQNTVTLVMSQLCKWLIS